MIGILDWDLLSTKKFCNYNFGVLLVSSYYLEQGIKCRLILDISYDNLKKYNKNPGKSQSSVKNKMNLFLLSRKNLAIT